MWVVVNLKSKNRINVFIDTNIIENDWFFQSKNMKIILYLIKAEKVTLHVSSVVMEEFRKHFKTQVYNAENEVIKSIKQLKKYDANDEISIDQKVDTESLVKSFNDNTIEYLVNYFQLVKYPKDSDFKSMMDTIIHNAINEIPPFKKKDDGFRDSIIFESYLHYIKSNKLSNNYFVNRDDIFKQEAVQERINTVGVQLEIIDNFDVIFANEIISPLLEKKIDIIQQEKSIERKIREYINKNKEFISRKFVESFIEGLNKEYFKNSEVFTFFDYKVNKIYFDYEIGNTLWVSVDQEIKVKLIEFGQSYDEQTKKQTRYKVRDFIVNVGGSIYIEILLDETDDFNNLTEDRIVLNAIDAEQILDQGNYGNNETRYEEMPV